jgi:hypothetical protein
LHDVFVSVHVAEQEQRRRRSQQEAAGDNPLRARHKNRSVQHAMMQHSTLKTPLEAMQPRRRQPMRQDNARRQFEVCDRQKSTCG